MLTADLAIEHALNAYGHKPDMVAGHSLGEYALMVRVFSIWMVHCELLLHAVLKWVLSKLMTKD